MYKGSLMTVRAAIERDYPAVARIQASSPEAAQWPVGDYSNYSVLLAIDETGALGFCAWRQTSPQEAELLNLAVAPAARRKGVASALLRALLNTASGDVFLEVSEANTAARTLYEREGWEAVAVRKGYYENGSVNAVVMKKGSWYSPG
jgi:ribosomal protein S18 acetylase RimI-like enzyme